jgi:hypothetical protein
VLIHLIHTGETKGVVGLDAARGHVVYSGSLGARGANFLDDVRFPNALGNCLICHVAGSYLLEGVPATASATIANETGTILHAGSALHPASDTRVLPLTSACMSCHDTGPGRAHAAQHTIGGVEACLTCHGGSTGSLSVPGSHAMVP